MRDRSSYAFALVSVPTAERLPAGQAFDDARSPQAAARLLDGTQCFRDNEFKIKLAQHAVVRALCEAEATAWASSDKVSAASTGA